jgi:hypothetical protein
MANEIVPSGIADLVAGEVMAAEFLMLLADRDGSVLTHPALFHATASSPSSTVVRVPHLGLDGYDLLSATTPGSEVANTAFTDDKTDVTIAMRAKRYTLDDLARYIADGKLDPVMFARDAAVSVAQTLISLLANVGDDFTSTVGSTGVNLVWTDIIDAKTTIGVAKGGGPMLGVLHPQQWGDLETDAFSAGVLPAQTMGGTINASLDAYKGSWLGIDLYTSSHTPLANTSADRAGFITTLGGLAWADSQMAPENDPNIIDLGRARLERVRQGTYVATSYVVSYAAGVAKAIDGAGVSVVSDA